MLELNLPHFDIKIRKRDRLCIWDQIRKKYVTLTPEEWVRQHFVNYLITEKKYSSFLFANEVEIRLNNQKRRCDTVIYNNRMMPLVIVEYKSPSVCINQDVLDQIIRYNIVLKVNYLIVSNGLVHYCFKVDSKNLSYISLDRIPEGNELSE